MHAFIVWRLEEVWINKMVFYNNLIVSKAPKDIHTSLSISVFFCFAHKCSSNSQIICYLLEIALSLSTHANNAVYYLKSNPFIEINSLWRLSVISRVTTSIETTEHNAFKCFCIWAQTKEEHLKLLIVGLEENLNRIGCVQFQGTF